MSDNRGGEPGNRSSGGDADSWFKPSENRFLTQSDYQDPMEVEDEPAEDAPEEPAAVFPDSGGYSGLSASRPALVEPYPDALGLPPTPEVNPEPQGPPGISYPGAGTGAYQPVTRIPGEGPPAWESPSSSSTPDEPSAPYTRPEWGAHTADVPVASDSGQAPSWERSAESRDPIDPLWPRPEENTDSPSENIFSEVPPGAGSSWGAEFEQESVREWEEDPSGSGGYPGIAASAQVPLPPEEPEESGSTAASNDWTPVPDLGDDWKGRGTREPWTESESDRWTDPSPSYLEDRRYEPSSPAEGTWDELSAPSRSFESAGDGGLGTGSGNTWAFDRNDPRLPDVVRDAERRRREEAGLDSGSDEAVTERDSGPDTGELSAAIAGSEDPLAAIANMQSRAKAKETEEPGAEGYDPDPYRDEGEWPSRPWSGAESYAAERSEPSEEPSWSRGAEGATQMFTAPAYDEEPSAYGLDVRSGTSHDELGFDGRGIDGYARDDERSTDRGSAAPTDGGWNTGGYDELGYYDRGDQGFADEGRPTYDDRGYDDRGYADQGYADPGHETRGRHGQGYADQGYAEQGYADSGHRDTGYPDQGFGDRPYGDQGYGDRFQDELSVGDRPSTAVAGVPSDLGSPFGSQPQSPADTWNEGVDEGPDLRDEAAEEPGAEDEESEYDDGFTPADYGMTDRPRTTRRRRDRIVEEDFPGFEDRPLGGEAGDSYPGYDSVDFLADTDPGAVQTLWLGAASLIPFVGVITAILALFVTGPKAKKAIRGSRGALDGLGLITTGTVFAVVGIVVTVISVAILLVL